jgi:hypothetical protein
MTGSGYSVKYLGAKWAVASYSGRYSYFVRSSDNKEINIFLNPAIYGGVSAEVVPVWDTSTSSIKFQAVSPSELDDRYTVGKSLRLVFGASTSSPVFDTNVDLSAFELLKAYEDAKVVPILLFRVGDYRLASHDYYAVAFNDFFDLLKSDVSASPSTYNDNMFVDYLSNPKSLFTYWFTKKLSTCTSITLEQLDNGDIWLRFDLNQKFSHDNRPLLDDERLFSFSDTLAKGNVKDVVLDICGLEFFPYTATLEKPLNGNYTIIGRPERLIDFNVLVSNAVDTAANNITNATAKNSFKSLAKTILSEGLKDWFRPSTYSVQVVPGTPGIKQNVTVYLAFQGSNYSDGVVLIDSGGVAIGVPVQFGDTFDYTVMESGKAYPDSKSYITGPYGAIPVYDNAGNIIGWISDAYTR